MIEKDFFDSIGQLGSRPALNGMPARPPTADMFGPPRHVRVGPSGHSTTVSARNRKGCGMFSLMALAVLRFITSSNFVRQIAGLVLLKARHIGILNEHSVPLLRVYHDCERSY